MAHSYEEWTAMPDDELVALYNRHAPGVSIGLDFISKELTRRQEEQRMAHMEKLTEQSAKQVSKLARLTEDGAEETKAMVALTVTITRLTEGHHGVDHCYCRCVGRCARRDAIQVAADPATPSRQLIAYPKAARDHRRRDMSELCIARPQLAKRHHGHPCCQGY